MRTHLILPALALALPLAAGAYEHDPHKTACVAVHGTLVPECNGTICNVGRVTGDLQGRFTSRNTSLYPAKAGWLYSSYTRITLEGRKGTMEFQSEGNVPFDAKGGPDQSRATEVMQLAEATGAYEEYSATLVMVGAHIVGRATEYTGRLCRAIPRG